MVKQKYSVFIIWNAQKAPFYTTDTLPDVCSMDSTRIWALFVYREEETTNPLEVYITVQDTFRMTSTRKNA